MNISDFLRLFLLRAPNIMWLLGAGASAAAGAPTASHMIWDFKRKLYCSRERVNIRVLEDLGDPFTRSRLQSYFDRLGNFPPEHSPEEYSFYFEATYPNERDRRRYFDAHLEGARPSYGHLALAALMKVNRVRAVWTTNFDKLVEDAAARVFGTTGKLIVAALGEPRLAFDAISEERWPLLGKMHGDYHSMRLKNIAAELREQDVQMRDAFVECCRRFGLAVVGYSGRDDSIMGALENALKEKGAYPFGLYWFHRDDAPVLPRVTSLIKHACEVGIEAEIIPIETFDELTKDLLLLESDLPAELTAIVNEKRPKRVSNVPVPLVGSGWPVLRFNAVPIESRSNTCRLVRCEIGGMQEIRQAIVDSGADIIAARRKAGVICFGRDVEIRRVFSPYGISEFGVYPIEPQRLRYLNSAELGLLYDAIGRALARDIPVIFRPGRVHRLVVDPSRTDIAGLTLLSKATNGISGVISSTGARWAEAVRFRIEYRLDRLWLLLEPTIWLDHDLGAPANDGDREFIRKRLAARYNPIWNSILEGWIALLIGNTQTRDVRAFGIEDGIDATFTLSGVTGFSRRNIR